MEAKFPVVLELTAEETRPLTRGRSIWVLLSIFIVAATFGPSARAHPVDGSQLVSDNLPSEHVTSETTIINNQDKNQLSITEEKFPDDFRIKAAEVEGQISQPGDQSHKNGTMEMSDAGSDSGVRMMDQGTMNDILDFLEVDTLNSQDPALGEPEGLKVQTSGGNRLQVTKSLDGSISVNGSVIDGVMTLPDGTVIYTLEKFLEQHKNRMDEAFRLLATQSKSLRQSNGRNFVTKPQDVDPIVSEKVEVSAQIPQPSIVADPEPTAQFSISVSQVTEISTRTAPPEISLHEGDDQELVVTEGLTQKNLTDGGVNQGEVTDERFHGDDLIREVISEVPVYEEVVYEDIIPQEIIHEEVIEREVIPVHATQNETLHQEENHFESSMKMPFQETVLIPEVHEEAQHEAVSLQKPVISKEIPIEAHSPADSTFQLPIKSSLLDIPETDIQNAGPDATDTEAIIDYDQFQSTTNLTFVETSENIGIDLFVHGNNSNDEEPIALTGGNKTDISFIEERTDIADYNPVTDPIETFGIEDYNPVTEPIETTLLPMWETDHGEQILETEHDNLSSPQESGLENNTVVITELIETTSVLGLLLDSEQSVPVTEHIEATSFPEQDVIYEQQNHGTEPILEIAEEEIPVTELGPAPTEVIPDTEEPMEVTTAQSMVDNEPVTEIGVEIVVDSIPRTEISFKTSGDIMVATESTPVRSAHVIKPSPVVVQVHEPIPPPETPKGKVLDTSSALLNENSSADSFIGTIPADLVSDDAISRGDLPSIPPMVAEDNSVSFLNIWNRALRDVVTKDARTPRTILTPEFLTMVNLVPQDSWHPFYDTSPENVALRNEFLQDYMVEKRILPSDPRLAALEHLNVTNFGGKDLTFLSDHEGYLSVNGVPVLDFKTLSDGTEIYILGSFLFDHKQRVEDTLRKYYNSEPHPIHFEGLGVVTEVSPVTEIMSTGAQPPPEESPVTESLEPKPEKLIPKKPKSIVRNLTSLSDIWEFALTKSASGVSNVSVPRTVITPNKKMMALMIPSEVPHPLYDETPEHIDLRREFLLDHLLEKAVETENPEVSEAAGLDVPNMNGKKLVFKKGSEGSFLINDVLVEKSARLKDGTMYYVIDGFLFDHQVKVETFFEKLLAETRKSGFGSDTGSDPVPSIPRAVDRSGSSSLIHLWRHAIRNQESAAAEAGSKDPFVVLSPSSMHVVSLVPADSQNPLYDDSEENAAMRSEILRDYLIAERMDNTDPKMGEPEGLTVKNLNGKSLTFKKYEGGDITINDVDVLKFENLSDGTQVYELGDLLFDHKIKVQDAVERIMQQNKDFKPLPGSPGSSGSAESSPEMPVAVAIPKIPLSVQNKKTGSLLYLWQYALHYNDGLPAGEEPKTLVFPEYKLLVNMVPPDALQPLYDCSPENAALRKEILLDYLIMVSVDPFDPNMTEPEGLEVENVAGKKLIFNTDHEGNTTVNGVPVSEIINLEDGVRAFALTNYLFNHKNKLDKAYDEMYGYAGSSDSEMMSIPDSDNSSMSGDGGLYDTIPAIPAKLREDPSITMYHLWYRTVNWRDNQEVISYEREPRTLLAPPLAKIITLAPYSISRLITGEDIQRYEVLLKEIVNDYLIWQFVNPLDDRLASPEGLTVKNINRKPLNLRRLPKGNHTIGEENVVLQEDGITINGVLIHSVANIKGYVIYKLKNLLFNHVQRLDQFIQSLDISPEARRRLYDVPLVTEPAPRTRSPSPSSMEETTPVPRIPKIIEAGQHTKLVKLWRHALDDQDYLVTLNDDRVPKTVISPGYNDLQLVPPGAPHPLYDCRSPKNKALRNEMILDYLTTDSVSKEVLREASQGRHFNYTVLSLNGSPLIFEYGPNNTIRINNVKVENTKLLSDGTVVHVLKDYFYAHRKKVKKAFEKFIDGILQDDPEEALIVDSNLTPAIKESIPQIPEVLSMGNFTTLIDIWRIALRHQNPKRSQQDTRVPLTIISPHYEKMVNIIPLVDETNASLRAQFLLDYLIIDHIDPVDSRMSQPTGLTVKNLNDRELTFLLAEEDHTINGLPATARTLADGIVIYEVDDLLFEHRARIDHAYEMMKAQPPNYDSESGTNSTDKSSGSATPDEIEGETVPGVPEVVKLSGLPSYYDAWREAEMFQGSSLTRKDGRIPKTVISPTQESINPIIPQVIPNPLMDNSPSNVVLRSNYLRDHLIIEPINLKEEFISKVGGQDYTNLNGKTVNFYRNKSGEVLVNGIKAVAIHPLRDGTVVFMIEQPLFDNAATLSNAYADLRVALPGDDVSESPQNGLNHEGQGSNETHKFIPEIPETVVLGRHSSLLEFWLLALEDQKQLSKAVNHTMPKTILNPDLLMMMGLIPETNDHPLVNNGSESVALRAELVLDHLILQSISVEDGRMQSPQGLRVKNFNGKEIIFKGDFNAGAKNGENGLTVNGVEVTKVTTLADGTQVLELADLLFDLKTKLAKSFNQQQEINNNQTPTDNFTPVLENDTRKEPHLTLPPIPLPAAMTPVASQTHLWSYSQHYQSAFEHLEDTRIPRTILSPNYQKMENLIPQDDRHPLYKNYLQQTVDLRAEFLLNYLVMKTVDEMDTRITQPQGMTVLNLLGKNITFTMDFQGNLIINGVPVEKIDHLDNNVRVYHLADFLYDHSDIKGMTDTYRKELTEQKTVQISSDVHRPENASEPITNENEAEIVTLEETLSHIPDIPPLIKDSESSLINLWRYSLRHQNLSFLLADGKVPSTVLSPIDDKMQNLVPIDSLHPLYDESPENVAFRTEFLLDYLIKDPVNPNDPRITEAGGLGVLNLNGKELIFSTDADGNLVVSGVPVENIETLPDGTQIYTLSDFLFYHKVRVHEALRKLDGTAGELQDSSLGIIEDPSVLIADEGVKEPL